MVSASSEVGEAMDRRQHKRFDLSAPVRYFWEGPEGQGSGQGFTRDVSECGMFVLTECSPRLGAAIEFEVSFPFRDDSQIQLKASGTVVRIELGVQAGCRSGFAAATKVLWLQKPAFSSSERTGNASLKGTEKLNS